MRRHSTHRESWGAATSVFWCLTLGSACAASGVGPTGPAVRHLEPVPIAQIEIGPDEVAWLSDSGRLLLRKVSSGWVLSEFGPDGLVEDVTVDEVSVLSVHRVLDRRASTDVATGPPTVIIDQIEYVRTADGWTSGACFWCAHEFPELPTVSVSKGQWSLRVAGLGSWAIAAPARWDGERPSAVGALDGSAAVAVAGRTTNGDTLVASVSDPPSTPEVWPVCEMDGQWEVVGVDDGGVVLVRNDGPGQRSTVRLPHCSSTGV